jgi:hypothetical protein
MRVTQGMKLKKVTEVGKNGKNEGDVRSTKRKKE